MYFTTPYFILHLASIDLPCDDSFPEGPLIPSAPVAPSGPGGPPGPGVPTGPVDPAGPSMPCCPMGPVAPVKPSAGPVAGTIYTYFQQSICGKLSCNRQAEKSKRLAKLSKSCAVTLEMLYN